jgi:hypothetical protein
MIKLNELFPRDSCELSPEKKLKWQEYFLQKFNNIQTIDLSKLEDYFIGIPLELAPKDQNGEFQMFSNEEIS